ncbi:zinc finger protein 90 isoform X2 [Orussus abietinus]|uniref:zinc finger protein 90 isoform X2 n=1 Tax=Orussus abietinus TaxID=222816 RepID=UPI000625137D|nr:zinc finger protein 90 isoform X2 [Orussus abietinus]
MSSIFCRLCSRTCDEYVNVFDQEGIHRSLKSKMDSCLKISVLKDDVLPKSVCTPCCSKLDKSYEFFEISQNAQLLLEKIYHSEKRINKSVGNEIKNFTMTDSDNENASISETQVHPKRKKYKHKSTLQDVPVNPRFSELFHGYPWSCTICEEANMNSPQEMCEHYKTKHNEIPTFRCITCGKRYNLYRSFVRHFKMHRDSRKYICTICGKSFGQKRILRSHATVHSHEKPHKCSTCGKAFKNSSSLYVHCKTHQPDEVKEKFSCEFCQKEFSTKHTLEIHRRVHTGERNFMCDICGKSFIAKGSLVYHLQGHDDTKHTCSTCGKAFKTSRLLTKHLSLHSVMKPHQCDACGKQFRERSTLKEHSRIHTGDMPYGCEHCGKRFRFAGILTVHRRQHTGERPYACAECKRSFTNWANYNKHMKRIHNYDTSNPENSRRRAALRAILNTTIADTPSVIVNKTETTGEGTGITYQGSDT